MSLPILTTKLYIPRPRAQIIHRGRLVDKLNAGLSQNQGFGRKLTLISAPAGFGKTTLVSEWLYPKDQTPETAYPVRIAWLSLDEGDNDFLRFLTYFLAALQTLQPNFGAGLLGMLQSPQPPPIEAVLTNLLNEIAAITDHFMLVLDDYHLIDAQPIDNALTFLLEHLPPQMHLVIATREDPQLPLARYRARGQLTELRAADLRFTPAEAAEFLTQVMQLNLTPEDIAALETRTEGWIAGLQLAALALQGAVSQQENHDTSQFIKSFTGSHHFVLDYLLAEVLHQQPKSVQAFLLRTSILDQLCGPLCDTVCSYETESSSKGTANFASSALSGQETLAYLQQNNLFIVPLDNERRWYRYHHLFADLLRQRLQQSIAGGELSASHLRASQWYEDHDFQIEAFHHAVAADDFERTAHLVEGNWMPLHFRGPVSPVLNWLAALPKEKLDSRPLLWVMYASAISMTGQLNGVEARLQSAEAALAGAELDATTRNTIGHIAAIRALLAATQFQADAIISESRRALVYLHPDNLAVRTATIWKMGIAYHLQGDRAAASKAYAEAIAICEASGNRIINISAATGLGQVQELENQLQQAAQTYHQVLELVGDPPTPLAGEAYLGLARIHYQWNDLVAAQQYGEQSAQLAHQVENQDRVAASEIFLAGLKLSQGDITDAAARLADADQLVQQHNLGHRIPAVAAAQVRLFLHEGNLDAAAELAEKAKLPISQVQVHLARGNRSTALAILEPLHQQMIAKNWQDERLKVMILQVLALDVQGENGGALQLLREALMLAETGGFIRIFVDEGRPMQTLLGSLKAEDQRQQAYIRKLLAVFGESEDAQNSDPVPDGASTLRHRTLLDPLSVRELEILQLIAQGLSNQEISNRLHLALSTVKGHNQKIFGKLQVQRRTEAVARARELGLI